MPDQPRKLRANQPRLDPDWQPKDIEEGGIVAVAHIIDVLSARRDKTVDDGAAEKLLEDVVAVVLRHRKSALERGLRRFTTLLVNRLSKLYEKLRDPTYSMAALDSDTERLFRERGIQYSGKVRGVVVVSKEEVTAKSGPMECAKAKIGELLGGYTPRTLTNWSHESTHAPLAYGVNPTAYTRDCVLVPVLDVLGVRKARPVPAGSSGCCSCEESFTTGAHGMRCIECDGVAHGQCTEAVPAVARLCPACRQED